MLHSESFGPSRNSPFLGSELTLERNHRETCMELLSCMAASGDPFGEAARLIEALTPPNPVARPSHTPGWLRRLAIRSLTWTRRGHRMAPTQEGSGGGRDYPDRGLRP